MSLVQILGGLMILGFTLFNELNVGAFFSDRIKNMKQQ